jgi:WD repeat-containing protein 42A
LLGKEKPLHKWNTCIELKNREIFGNNNSYNKLFEMRNYGSLNSVEKLELMAKLNSHYSCVNCLNFNKTGEFLVSGSDDLRIVLWKWSVEKAKRVFRTSHTRNIFQTKFIDESFGGGFKIVSASAEGSVFLSTIPGNGDEITTKKLFQHDGAVHKICVKGDYFLSCGEDGKIIRYDLRSKVQNQLVVVREKTRKISLFSISGHPLEDKFAVTGKSTAVRIYDLRNCKKPLKKFCPKNLTGKKYFDTYISSAVYSFDGREIVASYNDDFIYLFDSSEQNEDITGQNYLKCYKGHYNSATIKSVNFFGPRSQWIVSGSDCGNIYFWAKEHESIIQFMKGDEEGVVNVLEPHPHVPVSILFYNDFFNIKIWFFFFASQSLDVLYFYMP